MRSFVWLFVVAALLALPLAAHAQEAAPPPAHISLVEGSATLDRAGEPEPAVVNMPVLAGDRIRTGNGRVEVVLADGSVVAIDRDSEVEFLTTTRVRVLAGAIETEPARTADPRSPSSQYLPSDLQPYGPDLDQSGAWQYEAPYGYVWYPAVAPDWRPYYYGYWDPLPAYGWTWIGYDRWAWPTHHYGRWGYGRNRWFWIPGRTWAAAWVSWGTAPDYVSWCPLGYDGRPVFALSIGYSSRSYSRGAWTIVPRDRFGRRGYSVHRYAVEPSRVAATTPFIVHRNGPETFPRGSSNRRDGAYTNRDWIGARPRSSTSPTTGNVAVPRSGGVGVAGPRSGGYRSALPRDRDDAQRSRAGRDSVPPPGSAVTGRRSPSGPPAVAPPSAAPAPGRDHPSYRPEYQPQYQPRYGVPDRSPRYEPPAGAGPRAVPRAGPSARESAPPPPRQAGPPPSSRPEGAGGPRAAPPPRDSGRSRDSDGGRPAGPGPGAPHADRGRSGGQSQGTAVRRPR